MGTQRRRCIRELEEIRDSLHDYFLTVIPGLISNLKRYADELDAAYRDIKIAKVSGQAGCVTGGVLAAVGFGLSFVTFGASLGLVIAGGVVGGLGGATAGGASIGEFVQAKKARTNSQTQLDKCEKAFRLVLKSCEEVSDSLEQYGPIDTAFPKWAKFWAKIVLGSGRVASSVAWKVGAKTVINAIRLGKGIDVATDVTSAAVPVFRTLGTAGARGVHIAGGVAGAVFLPIDLYCLVSNSIELHRNTAHDDSKRIREIVKEIEKKCPTAEEIDDMVDNCISVLRH